MSHFVCTLLSVMLFFFFPAVVSLIFVPCLVCLSRCESLALFGGCFFWVTGCELQQTVAGV